MAISGHLFRETVPFKEIHYLTKYCKLHSAENAPTPPKNEQTNEPHPSENELFSAENKLHSAEMSCILKKMSYIPQKMEVLPEYWHAVLRIKTNFVRIRIRLLK
jgi:hypothetical protein